MSEDVRLALTTSAMMAVLSGTMSLLSLGDAVVALLDGRDCASPPPLVLAVFIGCAASFIGCAYASRALVLEPKAGLPAGSPVGLDPKAGRGECAICTARPADTTLDPCGHADLCLGCALEWNDRCGRPVCPVCRESVRLIGYAAPSCTE